MQLLSRPLLVQVKDSRQTKSHSYKLHILQKWMLLCVFTNVHQKTKKKYQFYISGRNNCRISFFLQRGVWLWSVVTRSALIKSLRPWYPFRVSSWSRANPALSFAYRTGCLQAIRFPVIQKGEWKGDRFLFISSISCVLLLTEDEKNDCRERWPVAMAGTSRRYETARACAVKHYLFHLDRGPRRNYVFPENSNCCKKGKQAKMKEGLSMCVSVCFHNLSGLPSALRDVEVLWKRL